MNAIRKSAAWFLLFGSIALIASALDLALLVVTALIFMAIEGVKFCDALWSHILMIRRQPKLEPLTKINDFPAQTKRPVR